MTTGNDQEALLAQAFPNESQVHVTGAGLFRLQALGADITDHTIGIIHSAKVEALIYPAGFGTHVDGDRPRFGLTYKVVFPRTGKPEYKPGQPWSVGARHVTPA